jgi:hypothetical protein
MPLWDRLRQGFDKAGKAAQGAFDEGKLRLEAYRAREQADKAAEALGYALFRASTAGSDLDPDSRARLLASVADRDAVARRLEDQVAALRTPGDPSSPPVAP